MLRTGLLPDDFRDILDFDFFVIPMVQPAVLKHGNAVGAGRHQQFGPTSMA
jgi:hypothetical protein